MKTKKILSIALMTLLVGAALTGCMNTANEAPVPTPTPTTNYMPQGTATDGSMNNANTQAAFDWKQNAAQIEARIGQISEISEARIVIAGNTALVGIKFNQAYQGELTERIREMVAAEIMAADTNISTVAVTSDPDDVQNVYKISDEIRAGKDLASVEQNINEIVRNATTLR